MYTGIWAKSRHIVKLLDSYFGVLPHPVNYTGHQDAFMFLGSGIPSLSFQVPLGAAEVDRMLSFRGGVIVSTGAGWQVYPGRLVWKGLMKGKWCFMIVFLNPYFSIPTKGWCVEERREQCCQQKMIHVPKLTCCQPWNNHGRFACGLAIKGTCYLEFNSDSQRSCSQ